MGQVLEFRPKKPSEDEMYSEEYINRQYELCWQEEMENMDEDAWQRGRDFTANQLVQKEQKKKTCLSRLLKKIFA